MIVVDASIVFKWIKSGEEYREDALVFYRNHLNQSEEVIVPKLLYIEIANAVATKSKSTPKAIREAMDFLSEAQLNIYSEELDDLFEAALLARKHKTSVYDMLYAVIAKRKKAQLITADANFVKKTGFSFVKTLGE